MDLIVCVGDHCHLNGSEMVVRCFQELLAEDALEREVTLKGSFCCGQCSGVEDAASVCIRCAGRVFFTHYTDAEACFREQIRPALDGLLADERRGGDGDGRPQER